MKGLQMKTGEITLNVAETSIGAVKDVQNKTIELPNFWAVAFMLIIAAMVLVPRLPAIRDSRAVSAEADQVVNQLRRAQRSAVADDADRRVRLTSKHGFVRERRAGAGWLQEQTYVLPEGMAISGPDGIEFYARGAMGPVAHYTITGAGGARREVVLTKYRTAFTQ
jgi:hypothetical protein